MTKTLLDLSPAEPDQGPGGHEAGLVEAVVRDSVLSALGEPPGLHHVQVARVWDDNYRVNVFVGPDVALLTIPHSYFVQADGDGKILRCRPPIARTKDRAS